MLAERRRMRQQHSSSSTLTSGSDLQPGDCYEEMLKYAGHLVRKSRRHLRRFARQRQLAAAARRQANPDGVDPNADASAVVVCAGERKSSVEPRSRGVSVCEADNTQDDNEARRLSQQTCASMSSMSAPRRPSSLQIDSSSSSSSLRNSPAFASVVSLVSRCQAVTLPTPAVDNRKCSMSQAVVIDTSRNEVVPTARSSLTDTPPVQYLVLPLEVLGDTRRSSMIASHIPIPAAVAPTPLPVRPRSTSNAGSVQFVDTVKPGVHRTASVGRTRRPPESNQSLLARKASILSTGANMEELRQSSSLIKSSSFNGARRCTEKCFRFSPETKVSLQAADEDAERDCDAATDQQRRRTSGPSTSSASSSIVSPNFLEVPSQADVPAGPLRRVAPVGRAASFSEVEARQQRTHRPCVASLSVPSSNPTTSVPQSPLPAVTTSAAAAGESMRRRSFRVNDRRSPSVQHRAVRRAVSCRAAMRRPRKSSATVGRASSLNEGARGRRMAAETAANIGSLGLFGSDFLFCSQTRLSSTADIYRRMQQRARLYAALSNDSGMSNVHSHSHMMKFQVVLH